MHGCRGHASRDNSNICHASVPCRAKAALMPPEEMIQPDDIAEACLLPFRMSKAACPTGEAAVCLFLSCPHVMHDGVPAQLMTSPHAQRLSSEMLGRPSTSATIRMCFPEGLAASSWPVH